MIVAEYIHKYQEDGEWAERPVIDCNCISKVYKRELLALCDEYIADEEAEIERSRKWLVENRDPRDEHDQMKTVLYSAYADTAPITVGLIKTLRNVFDVLPECNWTR